MTLMVRTDTSRVLSQERRSLARQKLPTQTDWRCSQQHGLSTLWPCFGNPWYHITDRSTFSSAINSEPKIQYYNGRVRVCRPCGERAFPACIRHRHTGPLPRWMVYGTIGYTPQSALAHTDDILNSGYYTSVVFRLVILPFYLSPAKSYVSAGCTPSCCQHYSDLSWNRKISVATLACMFFKFLTYRKGVANACQLTGSSEYVSHNC